MKRILHSARYGRAFFSFIDLLRFLLFFQDRTLTNKLKVVFTLRYSRVSALEIDHRLIQNSRGFLKYLTDGKYILLFDFINQTVTRYMKNKYVKSFGNDLIIREMFPSISPEVLSIDFENFCFVERLYANYTTSSAQEVRKVLLTLSRVTKRIPFYGDYNELKALAKVEEPELSSNSLYVTACATHGDLHNGNILMVNNKCVFIDWEYSCFMIPGYDLFHFMFGPSIESMNNVLYDEKKKKYFTNIYYTIYSDHLNPFLSIELLIKYFIFIKSRILNHDFKWRVF